MSIFDIITSVELSTYWEQMVQDEPPYVGEELFPSRQKLGLKLSWLKGSKGLPVVLKLSAFDTAAIPRGRIGFEKMSAEMPYFKESTYIDEELRQNLLMVLESNNQAIIEMIMVNIFDDEMQLLRGARAQRERMRMMLLSTGTVAMESNGQSYLYDYGFPEDHKTTVSMSWSNPSANILKDIKDAKQKILTDTGVTVTRALCGSVVLENMRKNEIIRESILGKDSKEYLSDEKLKSFIKSEFELSLATNDKMYNDEAGKPQRFFMEDVFVMFPEGDLGTTWFGTTPEQADLMASNVANVSIVDTGVAITTMQKADPVNVETKVTMICLPDCPVADSIYILDITAE